MILVNLPVMLSKYSNLSVSRSFAARSGERSQACRSDVIFLGESEMTTTQHTHEQQAQGAWKVTAAHYAQSRPTSYRLPVTPVSRYLSMKDGCRLAIDVYLPEPFVAGGHAVVEKFPTITLFTPYYRRFKLADGAQAEANPNTGKFRDYFVPRGYAVVVIDVRGTGASFGTRDSFRSPRERDDSVEVVDWIVQQPWSNGVVGSTGISYLGAASDFLASTGHPAVRAIAPLFSVWDTYTDNYFPGGIQLKALTESYDRLMVALDHDRRDLLKDIVYFAKPAFQGPQPVDGDEEGALLKQALHEHLGNFRQTEFMPEFRFREEPLPYDPSFSSASFSPYSLCEGISREVAVLSVSGWMDGVGYTNGAIARFLTLKDQPRHLLIGPWDHGARIDVSPWRTSEMADFPWLAEILRFFDHYLQKLPTGLEQEDPVHYFSLHAQKWRSAANWPPMAERETFYLSTDSRLVATLPEPEVRQTEQDLFRVDFSTGTGRGTRYERIAAINSTEYYPDWKGRTDRMLSYTTAPLDSDAELAGHPLADLWLASSERDAAFFLYLSELEADGAERYVTEGLLRGLHRKETPCPDNYQTTWPFRSFKREDAQPMVPGKLERVRIPLLPSAWRFSKGSRIRLSINGADADHCGQVPHGRPPLFTLQRGGALPSCLILPLRYLR